jgi:hypothetical protein
MEFMLHAAGYSCVRYVAHIAIGFHIAIGLLPYQYLVVVVSCKIRWAVLTLDQHCVLYIALVIM